MLFWDELVCQYVDWVYWLVYWFFGNQYDVEDLIQEIFIRVFWLVQNYQLGIFEGWLYCIIINLFLDMVCCWVCIWMEVLFEDYDWVFVDEFNFEQIYYDVWLGFDLQVVLVLLLLEFCVVVVLCDIEGLLYEEIGVILGVKFGMVCSWIYCGCQVLWDYLVVYFEYGECVVYVNLVC